MKIHQPRCPECGATAIGTLERLSGVALFDTEIDQPDTEVEYLGTTEVWWNEQRTVLQDNDAPESPGNLPLVCCDNGHAWPTPITW